MYLSKLRISGFKSFANRVEVNFPSEGITSVVGPNGCGKSNIIDAIRWVLGEQRAKALRSSKMEDVIFSGTADRSAQNLAEVSLLIHNDSGVLPSDYTQVMITRRAFRSGESEYLINNQPCRLKDIHNLFYDTGMGAASYSLIEAKMIDSILSEKADERRTMFEEASGISKYKQQRKETLRQLERTAADLARVEDGLKHVQQNVNLFERQAKKAEKWRELRDAWRSLELSYQHDSYAHFAAELEKLQLEHAKDENLTVELDARRAAEEAALEEEKLALFDDEQKVTELSRKAAATQAEAIRLESETDRTRDRGGHLEESMRRLKQESEEAGRRLVEMERQRAEALAEAKEMEAFLAGAASISAGARERVDAAAAKAQEARSEANALGEERMAALEDLSGLKQRLSAAETELQHLLNSEDEWAGERDSRSERLVEQERLKESARRESAEAEAEAAAAAAGIDKALGDAEAARVDWEAARAREQALRQEHAVLESQRKLLASLEASGEGMDAGVKYLMKEGKDRFKSLLVDVLEVPQELRVTVERALGKSLQVVLVSDKERGVELMNALRDGRKGEAVFGLPGFGGSGGFHRARPDLNGRPGFNGWLSDAVRAPSEWSGLLEWSLGNHARVDSLDAAFALADGLKGQDVWFWTPEGSALHSGGALFGGHPAAEQAGLLQRKAQLQEAGEKLETLAGELSAATRAIAAAEARRAELAAAVEALRARARDAERRLHEGRARLQLSENQAEALDREVVQYRLKLESLADRKRQLQEAVESQRQEWNVAEEERLGLEGRFQSALERVQELEAERQQLDQEWRGVDQERVESEARLKAARARAEYLVKAEAELRASMDRSGTQAEEWGVQIQMLLEKTATLGEDMGTLHERLALEEQERDAVKAVYDAKVGLLEERRALLRRLEGDLREATQGSHQRSLRMEQARAALQNIRERMFETHEVDFSSEEMAFTRVEYDPDAAPEQISEYKEKLKNLGNINTGALEDYEAEKARLEEVQKQFDDLDRARQGLDRAIKKLDKAAREQFASTFSVVQKNFQEVFSSLFEGGEAQLALEEGVDPLDAKIEINARPTGKKMRGVSLLSGGERALTAISLLFALYLVRPSPYCIMDEVDGPLDDANIGRFVNLLRRFSHQTQFIVVTHNKRTMAASDMLYGVTQEIKG
ncbi:MAG: chromosome segregation protein, partial [Fibrobacteria bacterium]|nr:chromosome segregation protein [Fibrobacteria bacterium]